MNWPGRNRATNGVEPHVLKSHVMLCRIGKRGEIELGPDACEHLDNGVIVERLLDFVNKLDGPAGIPADTADTCPLRSSLSASAGYVAS